MAISNTGRAPIMFFFPLQVWTWACTTNRAWGKVFGTQLSPCLSQHGSQEECDCAAGAQRNSLGLAALQWWGQAPGWSRAVGNFSVGFAEIKPKCDSWVNGDVPADLLLWAVRPLVRETQLPLSLSGTSKLPAGTGGKTIKQGIRHN